MNMTDIHSIEELKSVLIQNEVNLLYVSNHMCEVCHAVKPKIADILMRNPKVQGINCETGSVPEVAGQYVIFSVPAVLVFQGGREVFRSARFIDFHKLEGILKEIR